MRLIGMTMAAMLAVTPALAVDFPMDTPTQVGGVWTACTGVTSDAREDARWPQFSLRVEAVGPGNEYLGSESLTVRTARGQTVINVGCTGPWILVGLAPGRYQLTGQVGPETENMTVVIRPRGQTRVVMRFSGLN